MLDRRFFLVLGLAVLGGSPAVAQAVNADEKLKVETVAQAAPDSLAKPLREALAEKSFRVSREDGTPWIDLWLRATIPATTKPDGPKGTILYPFLEVGEYLGAVTFHAPSGDYRDQEILEGSYTIRYSLQPVNGDHLGVSPHRDYFLLLPIEDDQDIAVKSEEDLNLESSFAAGSNHPAVFMLLPAPEGKGPTPMVVSDAANKRVGLVIELPVRPEEADSTTPVATQLIVIGVGPH
jgi:hypothetical protein